MYCEIPEFFPFCSTSGTLSLSLVTNRVTKCKQKQGIYQCKMWDLKQNQLRTTDLIHAFIALICQYLRMTSIDSHTILTSVWCHVSSPSWGLRSRWGMLELMLGDMNQRGWVPICLSGVNQDLEMWGWRVWNRCDEISSKVTFIYIVLLTIQIVSKQLHNIKIGTWCVNNVKLQD